MSNTEQLLNPDHIMEATRPFARAVNFRFPTQADFDALQDSFMAKDHPDFERSSHSLNDGYGYSRSETLGFGRVFNLPFRMALGLHVSVERSPELPSAEHARNVFEVYRNVGTIMQSENQPARMRALARSAVSGAVLEAAADRISYTQINAALHIVKAERLVVGLPFRRLKAAAALVNEI